MFFCTDHAEGPKVQISNRHGSHHNVPTTGIHASRGVDLRGKVPLRLRVLHLDGLQRQEQQAARQRLHTRPATQQAFHRSAAGRATADRHKGHADAAQGEEPCQLLMMNF